MCAPILLCACFFYKQGPADELLEAETFDSTLAIINKNVLNSMLEKNEAAEIQQDAARQKREESMDHRMQWRKQLHKVLDGDTATYIVTGLLILDVLRFFVYLLILEDIFSDKPWNQATLDLKEIVDELSIVILSIFCIEIGLTLIALGPYRFFSNPGYVADLIVIPLSLILEVQFNAFGGFLVFVRMWRMMRIMKRVTNAKQNRLAAKERSLNDSLSALQTNFKRASERLENKHYVEMEKLSTIQSIKAYHGILDGPANQGQYPNNSMQDQWEDTWGLFLPALAKDESGYGSPIGRGSPLMQPSSSSGSNVTTLKM